ncbi:helix-turn-helix transcriptional regulator [Sphingomonas sp. SCN 67-18]|uniref:helix-turn-helix transcriptional regulator n=1 Tax=Devosia sp. TaxID=1871048 RepID=UPI0025E7265B|nr:helix-turn-helix domain-containing protein [Sphingomonas sp. SCN 67-18]
MIEAAFLTDKDVASYLNLSPSWVRGQRHKRRHGLPHILDVDARYIGSCARYLRSEIDAFVAGLIE